MNILDRYKLKIENNYPRAIKRELKVKDKECAKAQRNFSRWSFIGCFENYYNEVMASVVAYRFQGNERDGFYVESTQILIACPKFDYRWVQDCYCTMYGYKITKDYEPYCKTENSIFKLDDYRTKWLNEIDLPKYKYSCYDEIQGSVTNYLRFYELYPSTEKLIKTGFGENIVMSKIINKLVTEEKPFLKYMVKNKQLVKHASMLSIKKGYKTNIPLELLIQEDQRNKKLIYINSEFYKNIYKKYPKIKTLVNKKYLTKYSVDSANYFDYLLACLELGLDLKDSKVYNPKEMMRMHDLRMNELEAVKLEVKRIEDKGKRKERIIKKMGYDKKVKAISKKYVGIEYENADYKIIVAKSVKDFYLEAKQLKHCLYRMGYYKKVADGGNLILFVRKVDKPDDPFVTVEYNQVEKSIVQKYGLRDSKPDINTKQFLSEWVSKITNKNKLNKC